MQPEDWDRPTPCTEWTLRDLAEHVTGGNRFTIFILSGDSSPDAMASARRSLDGDLDTRRSLTGSLLELEGRFVIPGVFDQICHHLSGDKSGYEVLRRRKLPHRRSHGRHRSRGTDRQTVESAS